MPRPTPATLVVALAVLVAACSSGGDGSTEATTTLPPETTTTTEVLETAGEIIGSYQPAVGDCFDRRLVDRSAVADAPEGSGVTPAVLLLDCGLPHRYEVFAVVEVPDEVTGGATPDGPPAYPGDTALATYARAACTAGFAAYVGQPYEVSDLDIDHHLPTASEWGRGLRDIGCLLYELAGGRMVGSAQGAAR
jgi:hypothetical protein